MDVFVWKSYGDIEVFSLQTVDECESVLNNIIEVLDDWCATIKEYRMFLSDMQEYLTKNSTVDGYKRVINWISYSEWIVDIDGLESGSGIYKLL